MKVGKANNLKLLHYSSSDITIYIKKIHLAATWPSMFQHNESLETSYENVQTAAAELKLNTDRRDVKY